MKFKTLLLILFLLHATIQIVFANTCEDCKNKNRSVCAETCEGKGNYYNRCFDSCTTKNCMSACSPNNIGTEMERDSQTNCKICITKLYHGDCKESCQMKGIGSPACLSDCAKKGCTDECSLPDITSDRKQTSLCPKCKNMAAVQCRQKKCLNNEEGCMFECVDTACLKYCSDI